MCLLRPVSWIHEALVKFCAMRLQECAVDDTQVILNLMVAQWSMSLVDNVMWVDGGMCAN